MLLLVSFLFFVCLSNAQCSCVSCTCDGTTPCPLSIGTGHPNAHVRPFSCTAGNNVQFGHRVQNTDGTSTYQVYILDDTNFNAYTNGNPFTFFTPGSSPTGTPCLDTVTTNTYASNKVYLIYQCNNAGTTPCPTKYQTFSFSCVAGGTTTTTTTTSGGGGGATAPPSSPTPSTGPVDIFTVYAPLSQCTGAPLLQYTQPTTGASCVTACLAAPCSCLSGVQVQCNQANAPPLLAGPAASFYGQVCNSGTQISTFSMSSSSVCAPASLLQFTFPSFFTLFPGATACGSVRFTCTAGAGMKIETFGQPVSGCASGTDYACATGVTHTYTVAASAGCVPFGTNGGGAVASSCGIPNSCFHESTIITYTDGKKYTLGELKEKKGGTECVVPHEILDTGYEIESSCGKFKLTEGHLIYTQNGLKAARDLVPHEDLLFSDFEETDYCDVTHISKSTSFEHYFGLNCLNSTVLANGIKTSTFERFHTVPSIWMSVIGRIFGIDFASRMGDKLAKLNLF